MVLVRMMKIILRFLVICLALSITSTQTAEAYTSTRTCSFANGAMWNTVSITTYPRNPAYKQRIVRLASRELYVKPLLGADRTYWLRYAGLRGTSREWYPRTLPASFWASAAPRSYTFYLRARTPPQPFDSLMDCTVRL